MQASVLFLSALIAVAAAQWPPQVVLFDPVQPGQGGASTPAPVVDNLDVLLSKLLYVPIPDTKGQIVGYYTFVSNQQYSQYFPVSNSQQVLTAFRQKSIFPITDEHGRLLGYYTATPGGSQQQPEIQTLTSNLYDYGLYPVENGQGQVVAIYSSFTFPPYGLNRVFFGIQHEKHERQIK